MGDASVTLDLDAREFDSRLAAIEQKVAQSGKRMGSLFNAGLGGLGGGLTQILGAIGGAAAIKGVVEYGARIQDLHEQTGAGTDALQHFGNAAEKNGSSLEAVGQAFRKLEIARSKALEGDGQLADSFLKLGVTITDLQKLNPEELMNKLGASALNAADTVKILGKNALELRTTLAGIADGNIKFDPIIDSDSIKQLKEADDTFKSLGQQGKVVGASIITGLGHAFDAVSDKVKKSGRATGEYFGNLVAGTKEMLSKLTHGDIAGANAIANDLNKTSIFGGAAKALGGNSGIPDLLKRPEEKAGAKPGTKPKRDFSKETDDAFGAAQEATKLTLSQLAARDVYNPEDVFQRGKFIGNDISKAQEAMREKQLTEDAAFAGNERDFDLHSKRYSQLTSGIGSLKESEKNIGVKEMVQSIEKSAQEIAKNTANQFVNK